MSLLQFAGLRAAVLLPFAAQVVERGQLAFGQLLARLHLGQQRSAFAGPRRLAHRHAGTPGIEVAAPAGQFLAAPAQIGLGMLLASFACHNATLALLQV